jgi:hypothetical protein
MATHCLPARPHAAGWSGALHCGSDQPGTPVHAAALRLAGLEQGHVHAHTSGTIPDFYCASPPGVPPAAPRLDDHVNVHRSRSPPPGAWSYACPPDHESGLFGHVPARPPGPFPAEECGHLAQCRPAPGVYRLWNPAGPQPTSGIVATQQHLVWTGYMDHTAAVYDHTDGHHVGRHGTRAPLPPHMPCLHKQLRANHNFNYAPASSYHVSYGSGATAAAADYMPSASCSSWQPYDALAASEPVLCMFRSRPSQLQLGLPADGAQSRRFAPEVHSTPPPPTAHQALFDAAAYDGFEPSHAPSATWLEKSRTRARRPRTRPRARPRRRDRMRARALSAKLALEPASTQAPVAMAGWQGDSPHEVTTSGSSAGTDWPVFADAIAQVGALSPAVAVGSWSSRPRRSHAIAADLVRGDHAGRALPTAEPRAA